MELFSEIYNCYYQIIEEILRQAATQPITEKEMSALASQLGFEESAITIVPKLTDGDWNLLKQSEGGYISKVNLPETLPLTTLQKSWLRAILEDKKMGLFMNEEQIEQLKLSLSDTKPLFSPKDFHYYDRFTDGDDYNASNYKKNFHILLETVRKKQLVNICYHSRHGKIIRHTYLPCKIEYSAKNNRFRLLALYRRKGGKYRLEIINIGRIESIYPLDEYQKEEIDLQQYIRDSYYKEPVTLIISNERNALERAMLHFANYEKITKKLDDTHYECQIFYNTSMETELLIEILSFGPMVQVTGPEHFVCLIRERLNKQAEYFAN